ncbi:hypothetical protein M0R45_005097 [Rubus argutus]|uniref:CG-1 domain-containing protein n=1 Tax=Rubus argutus TaxID=59490 RepID=A0AAW1YLL4_RUBAR
MGQRRSRQMSSVTFRLTFLNFANIQKKVMQQMVSAANHRWLRPAEICEILQNHKMFLICPEPEHMPPSGLFFLFNRKVVRHFRRDGHNWKKRKDGKTVVEGNEKLKVGGANVLHCYYTRGEENENFHRRSYRMLEKVSSDLSHIVLVHYLEVKRTKEYRNTVESENEVDNSSVPLQVHLDSYTPGPSLSHDLLFSIDDFAPDWAYEDSEIKVLITGRFLEGQHAENCKWSFETLNLRFEKLLSSSSTSPNCDPTSIAKKSKLSVKISSLLKFDNDEWDKVQQCLSDDNFSWGRVNEQSLQPLKEKLYAWLLQKQAAGGKGPSVLDEGGQGVLHLGAALGYDWALLPMKIAGVSVDFQDVNGWTALHWAAFCGRKRTVAVLIILGADPRAWTYSTIKNPTSKTPADLAFEEGHFETTSYLVHRYEQDNYVPQLLRSSSSLMKQ